MTYPAATARNSATARPGRRRVDPVTLLPDRDRTRAIGPARPSPGRRPRKALLISIISIRQSRNGSEQARATKPCNRPSSPAEKSGPAGHPEHEAQESDRERYVDGPEHQLQDRPARAGGEPEADHPPLLGPRQGLGLVGDGDDLRQVAASSSRQSFAVTASPRSVVSNRPRPRESSRGCPIGRVVGPFPARAADVRQAGGARRVGVALPVRAPRLAEQEARLGVAPVDHLEGRLVIHRDRLGPASGAIRKTECVAWQLAHEWPSSAAWASQG